MRSHHVIVVGAGFAGLSAAVSLLRAGRDVVLLEGADRVGGRVESQLLADGTRIDTGGQFICRDMVEINALASYYGRPVVAAPDEGRATFVPPLAPGRGWQIWEGVDALRARARATDLEDPALSGLTVHQWAQMQDVEADVRDAYLRLIDGLWCRSPADIAFRWLAGNDRRITNEHSEMEAFVATTMHALAEDLAGELGARLLLGRRVTTIRHGDNGATLIAGKETFAAQHVIMAVPPAMAGRIVYDPPPPEPVARAFAAWGTGQVIKIFLRYEAAFWRHQGLSGTVMFERPRGLYACDASREGLTGLVVFVGGPLAGEWHGRPQAQLIAFVRDQLITALGPETAGFIEISIRDWTDDAGSGGAYSDCVVDLAIDDAEAPLRQGFGPIRFAPSELSPAYPGYIEGAITMGRIAAFEAIAALNAG